ncbi:hypothetical protein ONE63_004905 [Megalurothrips usitatus]|uniref:CMP/dCMP-type deaminase domain-containing protein n=1 Tax=Megalurothrips usitatus TaxID=439358 RepID=A0AAV7X4C7_9NEOP|nr:hypothetical protein ONE63_004905 [Megalurothrips usitatus]
MPGERKRPRLEAGVGEGAGAGIRAVLPDELLADVALVRAYAGVIGDPKHTSRIIRALNDVHPIPELHHLKRVRRRPPPSETPSGTPSKPQFEVLLALESEYPTGAACLQALVAAGLDAQGLDGDVLTVPVPGAPPRTRAQFTAANVHWTCNFHEDAGLERLLAGRMFAEDDGRRHREWAARAAARAGAVVVDPVRNALVAEAGDARHRHPLRHAAMNAVDLVAWTQGAGAWEVLDGDVYDDDLPDKPPPVGTVRNRQDGDGDDRPVGPYLCTGYDVYLAREPCTMCAMALVHSRVKRVFYAAASAAGILGTRAKLHAVRALNHHYQVFQVRTH